MHDHETGPRPGSDPPPLDEREEELLNDLLDGRLDEAGVRETKERIGRHEPTREAWDHMRRLRALLRQDDGVRAPRAFLASVHARIAAGTAEDGRRHLPPARPAERGRTWRGLVPWLSLAAALVVVGVLVGRRAPLSERTAAPPRPGPLEWAGATRSDAHERERLAQDKEAELGARAEAAARAPARGGFAPGDAVSPGLRAPSDEASALASAADDRSVGATDGLTLEAPVLTVVLEAPSLTEGQARLDRVLAYVRSTRGAALAGAAGAPAAGDAFGIAGRGAPRTSVPAEALLMRLVPSGDRAAETAGGGTVIGSHTIALEAGDLACLERLVRAPAAAAGGGGSATKKTDGLEPAAPVAENRPDAGPLAGAVSAPHEAPPPAASPPSASPSPVPPTPTVALPPPPDPAPSISPVEKASGAAAPASEPSADGPRPGAPKAAAESGSGAAPAGRDAKSPGAARPEPMTKDAAIRLVHLRVVFVRPR